MSQFDPIELLIFYYGVFQTLYTNEKLMLRPHCYEITANWVWYFTSTRHKSFSFTHIHIKEINNLYPN